MVTHYLIDDSIDLFYRAKSETEKGVFKVLSQVISLTELQRVLNVSNLVLKVEFNCDLNVVKPGPRRK